MRKRTFIVLLLLVSSASALHAAADFSGHIKLFSSLFLADNPAGKYFTHESGDFAFKRLEARFSLSGSVSDKVSYFARLDAFSLPDAVFGGAVLPEGSVLGGPGLAEPFDLFMYEAYFKVNGFLLETLDLTVGKQRISWGTADKVSVVDSLNPLDLANFFTFDPDYFSERRPQTAVNLEFYLSEASKLQFVWLLSRQVSPLPAGYSGMVMNSWFDPASFPVAPDVEILVKDTSPGLATTNFGLRFGTVIGKTDVGLSFYRGNFGFPVPADFYSNMTGTAFRLTFDYAGQSALGLDLSGEALGVGFWAEAAFINPSDYEASLTAPYILDGQAAELTVPFSLFAGGFWKFVLGADYTVPLGTGLYLNIQYAHGLFDELDFSDQAERYFGLRKGRFFGELEDYLIGQAEYKLLREDLKLKLGGILELAGEGKAALVLMPGVEYKAADTVMIQAGAYFFSGDEDETKFGGFKNDSQVFLSLKLAF